jgi:scavenger receptor class B protein 1
MYIVGSASAAVLLLAVGIGLVVELPRVVQNRLQARFVNDGPASAAYPTFFDSTAHNVQTYRSTYFFNVTNAEDVMAGRADPVVEELGPYTYQLLLIRPEAYTQWMPNGTVRYKRSKTYTFVPSMSSGSESDVVVGPNIGIMSALLGLQKRAPPSKIAEEVLQYVLSPGMSYFVTRNVSAYQFGFEFLGNAVAYQPNSPANLDGAPYDAIYTGGEASATEPAVPSNAYNSVTQVDGYFALPYWNSAWANMLNGSRGDGYAPGAVNAAALKAGGFVYTFVHTLLRSLRMTYYAEYDADTVQIVRIAVAEDCLRPASEVPENADFYIEHKGFVPAPPSQGRPMLYSHPRFIGVNMTGVNVEPKGFAWAADTKANRDRFNTILDVEPMTGVLYEAHQRIQMNVRIAPLETRYDNRPWKIAAQVRPTYLPVMWADRHFTLPQEYRARIKGMHVALRVGKYFGGVLIAVGAVLALLIAAQLAHEQWRKQRRGAAKAATRRSDEVDATIA